MCVELGHARDRAHRENEARGSCGTPIASPPWVSPPPVRRPSSAHRCAWTLARATASSGRLLPSTFEMLRWHESCQQLGANARCEQDLQVLLRDERRSASSLPRTAALALRGAVTRSVEPGEE
jgi:hypothetical protein